MKPHIKTVIYNTDAHNMQVLLNNYLDPSAEQMTASNNSYSCLSDYAKDIFKILNVTDINQFTRLPELLSAKWRFINFINDSSIEVDDTAANNYLEILASHIPKSAKEIDIMIDLLKFHSNVASPTMSSQALLEHWFDYTPVSKCHYTQINTMGYTDYATWLISIIDSQLTTELITILPKLEYVFTMRRRIMRAMDIFDLNGFEHLSFLTYGGDLKVDNVHELFNIIAQHYDQCEGVITNTYRIVNIRNVETTVAADKDEIPELNLDDSKPEVKPNKESLDSNTNTEYTLWVNWDPLNINSNEPMKEGPVFMITKPLLPKKHYRVVIEGILHELHIKVMYAATTVSDPEKQTIETLINKYYNTLVNRKKVLAKFSEMLVNYRNTFYSRYPDLQLLDAQVLDETYGFSWASASQFKKPLRPYNYDAHKIGAYSKYIK